MPEQYVGAPAAPPPPHHRGLPPPAADCAAPDRGDRRLRQRRAAEASRDLEIGALIRHAAHARADDREKRRRVVRLTKLLYADAVRLFLERPRLLEAREGAGGAVSFHAYGSDLYRIELNPSTRTLSLRTPEGRHHNYYLYNRARDYSIFDDPAEAARRAGPLDAALAAALGESDPPAGLQSLYDRVFVRALGEDVPAADADEYRHPSWEGHVQKVIYSAARRVYGHHAGALCRIGTARLLRRLDPEVLRLTFRAGGYFATTHLYSMVWQNLESAREADRLAAAVLPLWQIKHQDHLTGDYRRAEDLWENYGAADLRTPNILAEMKRELTEAGLRPAGWRLLLRLKPLWLLRTTCSLKGWRSLSYAHCLSETARFLNLVARAGVLPKFSTFVAAYHRLRDLGDDFAAPGDEARDEPHVLAFLRAGFADSLRAPARPFAAEFGDACDWLRAELARARAAGVGAFDPNQMKAGWPHFRRRSEAWHAEQQKGGYDPDLSWRSLLAGRVACSRGRLFAHPLTTHKELAEEGAALGHCVRSYASRCAQNRSRIFSLRTDAGGRLATFELTRAEESAPWAVSQVQGKSRREITAAERAAARRVCALYNAEQERARRGEVPDAESVYPPPPAPRPWAPPPAGEDDGEEIPF